jgi:hypothetical protein
LKQISEPRVPEQVLYRTEQLKNAATSSVKMVSKLVSVFREASGNFVFDLQ